MGVLVGHDTHFHYTSTSRNLKEGGIVPVFSTVSRFLDVLILSYVSKKKKKTFFKYIAVLYDKNHFNGFCSF